MNPYNSANRLTSMRNRDSSNGTISSYDALGNRTSLDTTQFEDDFDRPDSSSLGADWTEAVGDWEIKSNKLNTPNASSDAVCLYSGGDITAPVMEVVMNAETGGNPKTMGVIVSYQSSADFYYAGAQLQQDKWVIGRQQQPAPQ